MMKRKNEQANSKKKIQVFLTCKNQISLKKNIQIFTFDLLQNKTTTFYFLDANTFSYE
jgi:hypothetical protein